MMTEEEIQVAMMVQEPPSLKEFLEKKIYRQQEEEETESISFQDDDHVAQAMIQELDLWSSSSLSSFSMDVEDNHKSNSRNGYSSSSNVTSNKDGKEVPIDNASETVNNQAEETENDGTDIKNSEETTSDGNKESSQRHKAQWTNAEEIMHKRQPLFRQRLRRLLQLERQKRNKIHFDNVAMMSMPKISYK